MEHFMKDNLKTITLKAQVNIDGLMEEFIMVHEQLIKCMVLFTILFKIIIHQRLWEAFMA